METYDIYRYDSYKESIQARLKYFKKSRPNLTLRKIADETGIQYTYLSKVLNTDKNQLSEDQLYKIGLSLDFLPDEIDFLTLLRSIETSNDHRRKDFLTNRLADFRKKQVISVAQQNFMENHLGPQLQYMLNPVYQVFHVALFIKEYRKDPYKLASALKLSPEQLTEILRNLQDNEYITYDQSTLQITDVNKVRPHFGKEHPMTKTARILNRHQLIYQMPKLPEENKENFFVSFTMDDQGFAEIKRLFSEFLKNVQEVSFKGEHKHVYQLNFDLVKWF